MAAALNPILIVEDRFADLDLTKRAFARRRILNPIVEARDGEEAIAYIDKWEAGEPRPVCILLDLGLPKISGLEVLRRYKRRPISASIPTIVLTTSAEDQDIAEALQAGMQFLYREACRLRQVHGSCCTN
jgi:CheY-like chemotaxis protein